MQAGIWLILSTVFLSVFGVTLTVAEWRTGSRRLQSRIQRLSDESPLSLIDTDPSFRLAGRRDYLPTLTRMLRQQGIAERLKMEMLRAGLIIRPSEYVGLIFLTSIIVGTLSVLLSRQSLIALLGFIIGACAPVAFVKILQEVRRIKFEQQLADAFSLVASSLRSGYSFLRSLQMVAHEMTPPISQECQRVLLEVEVGVPIEDALWRWVDRMRSYDLDLAVTAVIIQLQVGGNLADILDTIAETIRERLRIKGEISSLTAEGRLSGIILFFAPVVLGLVLYFLNPGYLRPLFASPIGLPMIVAAVILQLIGGFVIMKMLTFDV